MITTAIVQTNFLNLTNAQGVNTLNKQSTSILNFDNSCLTLRDDSTGKLYYIPISDFKDDTSEVASTGSVELATGASGSVDSIDINGEELLVSAVAFDSDLSTTATAVALAITNNKDVPYTAVAVGAVITITYTGRDNTTSNGYVVTSTATTITTTDVNMASGVTALLNTEAAIRLYLSDKIGA